MQIYNKDSGCLELFNLNCFRTELRGNPSGERGEKEKQAKIGISPLSPYGFPLRLPFPSPLFPPPRFFCSTKVQCFLVRISLWREVISFV